MNSVLHKSAEKVVRKPRVAFVMSFCSHYTEGLFAILAKRLDVRFYFYSRGHEWYWQREHGIRSGDFPHEYLSGFQVGNRRFTPTLPWKLFRHPADVILSSIDGRFSLPMAYLAARMKRVPFLLWTGVWYRIETPFHRAMFPLVRFVYRHADAVIVYGEHVKHYLISEGVSPERIFVAAQAVDNSFYSRAVTEREKETLRAKLAISAKHKVVLYLGRLEKVKGVQYLIEAFAANKQEETILVIAGEGSERPVLEEMVRNRQIQHRVRFGGYIPVENTLPYYAIASVLVLPSVNLPQGKETWGLVVNEAFNQRVPVIATEAVGAVAGGLVRDGVNGMVVAERNEHALAEAIKRMLDDPDMRERMGVEARRSIEGWDHVRCAEDFCRAILSVMPRRNQWLAAKPQPSQELSAHSRE
jgi:glycosyltransferase involved in cell wall biosynthesis